MVVTVAALRILPRVPKVKHEPLDWAGALLLVVCFSSLIAGLSHFHEWGLPRQRWCRPFSFSW